MVGKGAIAIWFRVLHEVGTLGQQTGDAAARHIDDRQQGLGDGFGSNTCVRRCAPDWQFYWGARSSE